MSNQLPSRIDVRRAFHGNSHLVKQAEGSIFEAQVVAETRSAIEVAEITAFAETIRVAIDEEVGLLSYGTSLAAGSGAAAQLVAEKVALFSELNSRRLRQRYGG